jgi:predicted SprT family Zn-dependent metalloprotease
MWTDDPQINDALAWTFTHLGQNPYPVQIKWSKRMTRCAGIARPRIFTITLSTHLWARATAEQRRMVVIHEACHIIVERWAIQHGYRSSHHGRRWQLAMLACGLPPEPYHEINVGGLAKGAYIECACHREWSRPGLVNKILRGSGRIRCVKCRTELTWEHVDLDSVKGVNIPDWLLKQKRVA